MNPGLVKSNRNKGIQGEKRVPSVKKGLCTEGRGFLSPEIKERHSQQVWEQVSWGSSGQVER